MINKNKFSIRNTKKVLHKVGKQWVVVSAVLLGLVAGGAAVTNANADQTAQAAQAQPTTQISPADKAKAQNAIADLKAHKGDIVKKGVNEVQSHVNPANASQSNAYQGLASMASASNLAKFSNGAELGSANSNTNAPVNINPNTWLGALQDAENYANAIGANSSKYNEALNMVNNAVNTPIPNKTTYTVTNYPYNLSNLNQTQKQKLNQAAEQMASKQMPSKVRLASLIESGAPEKFNKEIIQINDSIKNNPMASMLGINPIISMGATATVSNPNLIKLSTPNVHITNIPQTIDVDGTANLSGITPANIINHRVDIPVNGTADVAYVKGTVDPITLTTPININAKLQMSKAEANGAEGRKGVIAKLQALGFNETNQENNVYTFQYNNPRYSYTYNGVNNQGIPVDKESATIVPVNTSLSVGPLSGDSFSTSTIADIIQGKNNYSNDPMMNAMEKEAHNQIVSNVKKEEPAKAQRILDAAVDAIHAGDQMLGQHNMSTNYNNIVNALATLPNDNTKASLASQLKNIASNANSLASSYASESTSTSVTPHASADSSDTIRFLSDAARQASSYASQLDSSAKPASNIDTDTIDINGAYTSNGTMTSSAGATGTVYASNGYHFTNGNASSETFTFDDGNHTFTVDSNSVKPQPKPTPVNPQPSNPTNTNTNTNTNKGTYVPQVASSSSANSSVASSSASASVAPASVDVNDLPPVIVNGKSENGKHAVNYAKVVKALQLHTNPNFTKRNGVAVVKPGSAFKIEKSVKAHNGALRYEVKYNKKNYFITANKRFVNAYYKAAKHANHANHSVNNYVHYRYAKVIKHLRLHTSAKFTKRNGVKAVRPGAEFHINHIVKNHGLVRYEVRHNHKNYFITASHHYTVNAYVQKYNFRKHGYKAVRVIKPLDEYRKLGFSKRNFIRHFYRGSVLPVKRVVTIASGEMTRLQLTNGRYVSANKDFVEPIR